MTDPYESKTREQLIEELKAARAEIERAQAGESERERLSELTQAQLARAKRLETAGTIAGQIAHDFNNLLTPLMAYPSMIRKDLAEGSQGREVLDIMEKTAHDMAHITQQLLSLSRRGRIDQKEFNVNDIVQQALSLLKGTKLPPGIQIQTAIAEDLDKVKGGDDQILRVVQNIFNNAIDAMGEQGTLSVKTENVKVSEPIGHYDTIRPGEYVRIMIGDTGCGIPDAVKDRIFDPFFSTKKATRRRGSGLGLSVVHGIVKDHGGYVDLQTVEGKGSVFSLYLPVVEQPAAAAAEGVLKGGHETILIVDDDPTQIEVNSRILSSLGYTVHGVESGEEAVAFVRKNTVDLIVLDIVMPLGIDGLETYRRIKEVNPDQRAIIVSAFDELEKVTKMQSMGAGQFIRKVVSLETLGRAVRQELDKALRGRTPVRGEKVRILLVDDEEMIRSLFRMILSSALPDVTIDTACNGAEAVEAFNALHHALLVMDLNMPVMDGREAFAKIQQACSEKGWEMPPVIFCTGFAPPESVRKTVAQGDRHMLLSKPVTEEALLKAIKDRI